MINNQPIRLFQGPRAARQVESGVPENTHLCPGAPGYQPGSRWQWAKADVGTSLKGSRVR